MEERLSCNFKWLSVTPTLLHTHTHYYADEEMKRICFMTTLDASRQQWHWTCMSTCLVEEYTFLCPSPTTTLNHDNVRNWYNISNLTLPSDRGDQDLSNSVKHIKIGPLLTKLEAHTYVVPVMADSQWAVKQRWGAGVSRETNTPILFVLGIS